MKKRFIKLFDTMFNRLVKMMETLSGAEFSSKIFETSSYKATLEMLKNTKNPNHFAHEMIKETVGGKVTSFNLDSTRGGIIRVKSSLEASSYGTCEKPVCHITKGIIKAVAEKMLKKSVNVVERKCGAMGNDCCEFAVLVEAG